MDVDIKCKNQIVKENYALYNGDSCEIIKAIPDNSIDYILYSPPFSDLYVYSDNERDLGNSKNYDEFWEHYLFLIKEQCRILKEGRIVSIHCMNLPLMKEKDGYIGIRDFRGDLIREFEKEGFIFHSEVVIWKDPLIEVTRTKALGLMHKQLIKDSSMCRMGIPDTIISMRKKGDNKVLINHNLGLTSYAGSSDIIAENETKRSHYIWQKYASPVWFDIRQTLTLNRKNVRTEKDEKHICPLQFDTIERCITLWSNPDEIVCSIFSGIGSEIYKAIELNRKGIGIELKEEYFNESVKNCAYISDKMKQKNKTLFN